ncbi:hypothetical protein IT412_02040 [Candidatus Peregrinibacteria bacterium]|nr:hypothetical protein [Candidatus Peregrinibacteria bacterium]
MQTLSNDFDSMESINQKPPLTYVLDLFKECYDRAFNQDAAAPLPKPDLEKDQPIGLETYQKAIATLDFDPIDLQKRFEVILQFAKTAKPKDLQNYFKPGQKFCYNLVPLYDGGTPSAYLRLCRVTAKGLTLDITSDPAYYFLNFPLEIQQKCTFNSPYYESELFVKDEEREYLVTKLELVWSNLCKLLNINLKQK